MATIEQVNFVLGNRCESKCAHCIVAASPNSKIHMKSEDAISYAYEIAEIESIKEINFSGGEPFLYLDIMAEIIQISAAKNTKKVKISTGAGEFISSERTTEMLGKLKKVDCIWISLDKYHLEHIPLENYRNLDRAVRNFNFQVGYSISYNGMKELANALQIIKDEGFYYHQIIKQPIMSYGRAAHLSGLIKHESQSIPPDYKCCETKLANIWPDGSITSCGAYAGRAGYLAKTRGLKAFIEANSSDEFSGLRDAYSFKEIAERFNMTDVFDVTSPCAVCKFMLKNGLLGKIKKPEAIT